MPLLEVRDLHTSFRTDDGIVRAIDGVSFTVERGKVLGIVGESGSGKSVTSMSIMGLLPKQSTTITGEILFNDQDLLRLSGNDLRKLRGDDLAMIFQDPMTSLNPIYTIGWQLEEAVLLHQEVSHAQARTRARDMLAAVGIPRPDERLKSFPHEFSGGMRQRVMIAMALANDPDLLIADEPTTALDVTTQSQILNLIRRLKDEFDSAVIMITHDLGVVAEICDDVLVMYAGKVAEQGPVDVIFDRPQHPYTWGLMRSMPSLHAHGERLRSIPGAPPSLLNRPPGCPFHPRCPYVMDVCRHDPPPVLAQIPGSARFHVAACHLSQERKDEEAAKLVSSLKVVEV
jgi:peptide/nickel transport system ATP-binding protein